MPPLTAVCPIYIHSYSYVDSLVKKERKRDVVESSDTVVAAGLKGEDWYDHGY